jgi:hypothetical protein
MASPQAFPVHDVFALSVAGKYLLYSSFHSFAALLNRGVMVQLSDELSRRRSISKAILIGLASITPSFSYARFWQQ